MMYLLSQLAEMLDGELLGEDVEITGLASLTDAAPGDLAFIESPKYLSRAQATAASALIVTPGLEIPGRPVIRVAKPRLAFAKALSLFNGQHPAEPFVHPTAFIEEGAEVSPSATVMAYAVVGAGSTIGDGAIIHPLVHIGKQVRIGAESVLYPNVSVYDETVIGQRVRIHAGAVIGSDGFGYEFADGCHMKVPHIGNVIIGDEVEIGSNTSVDRAKTGSTRIGRGTKIDNLVQIGHNVQIGEHCLIVALVGLSGSVEVGDYAVIGGQVGVKDHRKIGKGAMIAAQSGIVSDVPAGETFSGAPGRPHKQWLKMTVANTRLPEMMDQMRGMERRIQELETRLAGLSNGKGSLPDSAPVERVAAADADLSGNSHSPNSNSSDQRESLSDDAL